MITAGQARASRLGLFRGVLYAGMLAIPFDVAALLLAYRVAS